MNREVDFLLCCTRVGVWVHFSAKGLAQKINFSVMNNTLNVTIPLVQKILVVFQPIWGAYQNQKWK
jgi:hypothetical protein